jgi:cysteine-rich repeat protein
MRRLVLLLVTTAALVGVAACTIELVDNDDDDDGPPGTLDGGWGPTIDAVGLDAASPWPDAGSNLDGGASPDAAAIVCGDGVVQGGEVCDNGQPGVNTAACDRDCTFAACGDGLANFPAGEQCDTGGASVSCDSDCTATVCGDGLVNPFAGEQCDDGNAVDTDACRNNCTLP